MKQNEGKIQVFFGDDKLAAEVALAIQQLKEKNEDGK